MGRRDGIMNGPWRESAGHALHQNRQLAGTQRFDLRQRCY